MRPKRVMFLVLLVLLSGAALLAVGGIGLWSELRHAEDRARLEARRATIATADALRRALREPSVLELVDPARGFEVAEGRCVVPPEVLARIPLPERPEEELPPPLREPLTMARAEPARAGELLAAIAASPLLEERSRSWLALQRAFVAERAGDFALRDALREELADAECCYRRVVAGVLALAAAAGEAPPEWAVARSLELDDELARGLRLRLLEAGAGELAARIERVRAAAATRERVLESAAKHLGYLLAAEAPAALPAGGELLLWFPAGDDAGRGALVEPVALLERIRAASWLDPVPWSGALVRGGGAGSEPVVASLVSLAPEPTPERGALGLALVIGAVALCFGGALWATFRVVRADAAAVRARAEFLQSVTHELKTPLASIRLLAERLESGRVGEPRRRDYYAMLADEAARLSVLIENVLDLGRIERGERAYDRRMHDAGEVVAEAVDVFRPLAHRDGIELRVDGGFAGVAAELDRGAIVQALLNVFENARKFAKAGARVAVRLAVQDGALAIDVRDFGPGVPAAEREAVFERFARGAQARGGAIPGAGLGLYLARSIARAHGGELECAEPDGAGALFRFRIPIREAS